MKDTDLRKKPFEKKITPESIMLKNLTNWKGMIHAVYRKIYLQRKKVYRAMKLLEKQQKEKKK